MADMSKSYKSSDTLNIANVTLKSLSERICKEWLEEKSRTVKSLSYDKYESMVNRYILPFLSDNPITELNDNIISRYLEELGEEGWSKSLIKLIKITLRGIYTYGEDHYDLKPIDFSRISASVKKKKQNELDRHDERILYDYCHTHNDALGASIMLCLYGGLKFTEICALQYKDINLREGTIDVHKKVQRNVNRKDDLTRTQFHILKLSYPEKRTVVLSRTVADYLRKYMADGQPDWYLLSKDTRLREQRKYQTMLKRLGEEHHFEASYALLRNTCKQRCLRQGIDINTIMSILGLSHIEISIEDTFDGDNGFKRKEMEKIFPDPDS